MTTLAGLVAGLLSAGVFGVAAVVQARAVRGLGAAADGLVTFVARGWHVGWIWAVGFAYVGGFVLHAVAITLLPLFLAQAMIAMQLPVTALLGRRIEAALGARLWTAVGTVSLGLVLLTAGSGTAGTVARPTATAIGAWSLLAAIGLLGLVVDRLDGSVVAVLAGLGYAATALSVRGLEWPLTLSAGAVLLAMPVYSVVAFWLYSVAMRRARVAAASAALIVVQTLVPAAVGVVALGDRVRPGWWPAVIVGLAMAVAGAVALARPDVQAGAESEVPLGG